MGKRIFHGPKNLDLILSKRKISCKEIWRQHIFLVLKLDRAFSPKKVLGQDKLLGHENIFYQKKKENMKIWVKTISAPTYFGSQILFVQIYFWL